MNKEEFITWYCTGTASSVHEAELMHASYLETIKTTTDGGSFSYIEEIPSVPGLPTVADLVSFGNFMLAKVGSKEEVHLSDLANWKEKENVDVDL